ncbi:MAG TPA: PAS domain S-box protein, partial [Anaerolineae bacterium]|nr:PAS domain S-box protein [Anaerolineae bacterium]
ICLVDRAGRYIQFNQRWAELLGRTPDEVYQLHNVEITHPDDQAISRDRLAELVSGAIDHYELEKRFLRADGSFFWGALSAAAIRSETGEFEASIGLVTDITERKQAEAALRASEARYHQIVELSPDGIAVHRNGRLIYVNQAGARLVGAREPDELIGKPMLELVHPDYRDMALARVRQSLQRGEGMPLAEEKFLRLDGSSLDVEVTSLPFEQDGQWSVQVIVRDITARKQAEADQRDAHARLTQHNQLLAQILETGNTLRLNLELTSLLPQIADAVRLALAFDTVALTVRSEDGRSTELRAQVGVPAEVTAQFAQAATPWSEVTKLLQPRFYVDGCYFIPSGAFDWAANFAAPTYDVLLIASDVADAWQPDDALIVPIELREGRVIGLLSVDAPRDGRRPTSETLQALRIFANLAATAIENAQLHHEVKRHAQHLEQRVADRTRALTQAYEQLKELDRMKDQFVSLVSHELRTPLANIKLYLNLLERGKPEKRDAYLQTLHRETARLNQLIEDLLDISRLDMGKTAVNLVTADLNRIVQDMLPDWQAQAAACRLTLTFDPQPDLPLARLDPVLLRQALGNVFANALNYTPAGCVIQCRTDMGVDVGQGWVTLAVRDSGPGMEPEEQLRIFERFYRGRAARNYKVPGTGLGLAICKEIMTRLGGRITVESRPGWGSVFVVWLAVA